MKEIFKDIPNYEGLYQVSNLGNVKSLNYRRTKKERVLKTVVNGVGYLNVYLSKNGKIKTFTVHKLVCMAFLNHTPNGSKGLICDHVNNNKLDNRLDNLQLITSRENTSKDKKNCSSQYTGVSWVKHANKWRSAITINGKVKYLGLFTNELEASNEYQKALINFEKFGVIPEPVKTSSKYKGVCWNKARGNWLCAIYINGKSKHLGYFTNEIEASECYQNALKNLQQLKPIK